MSTILIWAGDKFRNEVMHAADLFGEYKMLIDSFDPIAYQASDVPLEKRDAQMASMLSVMRRQTVIAAFYVPNLPQYNWRDRSIWQVSDGHKHMLLSDLLKAYGWEDVQAPYKIGSPEFKAARLEATTLLASAPREPVVA